MATLSLKDEKMNLNKLSEQLEAQFPKELQEVRRFYFQKRKKDSSKKATK